MTFSLTILDALDGTHAIGNMTVVGPIKVGENITLTFHPTNYSKPHSILLQYREGSGWINVSFERLYEDDIKRVLDFVIPNTKEALNGKDIYIVYNGIWGPYVRIKMCKFCNRLYSTFQFILYVIIHHKQHACQLKWSCMSCVRLTYSFTIKCDLCPRTVWSHE